MTMTINYLGLNILLAALAFWLGSRLQAFAPHPDASAPIELRTQNNTVPAAEIAPGLTAPKTGTIATSENQPNAEQLKDCLNHLGPLRSERAFDQMMALLLALAAKDPNAAVNFAAALKPPLQSQAMTGVLGIWATKDAAAAWSWVKTNQPEDSLLTGAVLGKIGATQPETAWQFATDLATNMPGQAAGLYVSALSGMTRAGNYQAAARLLGSAVLPSQGTPSAFGLTSLLASQWGEFAPQEAAQWVQTLPGDLRKQALLALNQSWVNFDPVQAVQFASQQPADSDRVTMVAAGLDAWFSKDPAAANAWVSSYPASGQADYDQLAAALAATPHLVDIAPENSVAWALSISDENLQMDSLQRVFAQWFRGADASAMARLRQLPPATQNELCRRLGIVNQD
ncbi:MAG TPA: hypothetical protein VF988_03595 [Verrucomicrobiae bacterium]